MANIAGAILEPALALLTVGFVIGISLGLADKYLKVEVDARVEMVNSLLPGFNCGACGSPGCIGHATGIVDGTAKIKGCPPIKADQETAIREYLGNTPGPDGTLIDLAKV